MRSPTSSEHACPTSGFLCGRLLVALVESVLRPGGWENMCRLMCHCVRHISLDNKHGRSVEAIHSFLSRWTAGTELCSGTQEEPCCKKSSMGSENRQRSFKGNLKSSVTRSIAPKRVALEIRRYLPERLLFPHSSMQSQRRRKVTSTKRVPRPTQSNLGGTDRIMADSRNLREHLWRFSLPIELFLPYGSSCSLCWPTELRASPPT